MEQVGTNARVTDPLVRAEFLNANRAVLVRQAFSSELSGIWHVGRALSSDFADLDARF